MSDRADALWWAATHVSARPEEQVRELLRELFPPRVNVSNPARAHLLSSASRKVIGMCLYGALFAVGFSVR